VDLSEADRVRRAVRQYVADRFDRPVAGLTTADCVEVIAPINAALSEQLATLLEQCDASRYGGAAGGAAGDLAAQASSLLDAIEQAAADGRTAP